MSTDSEANYPSEKGSRHQDGQPLAPTKSRMSFKNEPHTLENKPDDVDAAIWLEEVTVVGVQERKVSLYPFPICLSRFTSSGVE